ncbi:hypothetical protein UFOVP74_22 [uncultured Caudovirales phage]|uniref:Uncharacterized protein n=1 Tax=uncultured Caudovirales phage TaxID=2100421 RepID=A0A6J5KVD8_9CAUD|nr:hypothetical protein UFOVP74_22 [uncultured Caudovirales phage]
MPFKKEIQVKYRIDMDFNTWRLLRRALDYVCVLLIIIVFFVGWAYVSYSLRESRDLTGSTHGAGYAGWVSAP